MDSTNVCSLKPQKVAGCNKKCHIVIGRFDNNGYIHSLLGVAFIYKIIRQLQPHYSVEISIDNSPLIDTVFDTDSDTTVFYYAHGALIHKQPSKTCKLGILFGCHSNYKYDESNSKFNEAFVTDYDVWPGGKLDIRHGCIFGATAFHLT